MIYYNQRDYPYIPYPAPGYEKATVATSGCGPVCAAMIVSNMLGQNYTVQKAVEDAIACGARVSGGTNMNTLSKFICNKFNMTYRTTNSIDLVKELLNKGSYVICNVRGDVGDYKGLFSDSGHYVIATPENKNNMIGVLDPYMYNGKFNQSHRKNKIKLEGNIAYCSANDLDRDTKLFYIFEKEEKDMTVNEAKQAIKTYIGLSDATIEWMYNYRYGDDLLLKIAKAVIK